LKNNKTIVFDLGGVLIDWEPRHLYSQLFSDEDELDFFLRAVCSPEWNSQMDRGKSFQLAMDELSEKHPVYTNQIQAYFSRWEEMISGPIPESVKILEELHQAGNHLAALSNWSAETFPRIVNRFEFLNWFNPLIISGEYGVVKPDREIYQILLSALNKEPVDCVFIDDSETNIETAVELGFKGIRYFSPDQLKEQLENLGYL
jgi:2-haloacid dehalogenase